jgi:hypothetical protein
MKTRTARHLLRRLLRHLATAFDLGHHPTAEESPAEHAARPASAGPRIAWSSLPHEAHQAKVRLIAAMARLAAVDWEQDDTRPVRKIFEDALADLMAIIAPPVNVAPYDYGNGPADTHYLEVQNALLNLISVEWANGRQTTDDSMDLDFAQDRLEATLQNYVDAVTALTPR